MNERPDTLEELAARVGLEPMLTLDELAMLAKVSRRTIERAVAEKRLRVTHLSPRAVRVPRSSAAAFLAQDTTADPAEPADKGGSVSRLPTNQTAGGHRDG